MYSLTKFCCYCCFMGKGAKYAVHHYTCSYFPMQKLRCKRDAHLLKIVRSKTTILELKIDFNKWGTSDSANTLCSSTKKKGDSRVAPSPFTADAFLAKPSVTMHLGRSPVPMTAAIHSEKMVLKSVAVSFRWVYQNPNGCFHLPYMQRTVATITSSPGMLLARLFKADIMMLCMPGWKLSSCRIPYFSTLPLVPPFQRQICHPSLPS
ncbi:putative outer membrane protein PmpC [Frankliniella fusca]|uniref:Outer membrane protein PmpC n=1 Tax=Frankliniella fusca TaxID=407009 RepID=A0AAE1HCN5_9NEOP|nr:putative outer membrane protein PmpC [Frankliniella fusca]